jgi:hypothetical protein
MRRIWLMAIALSLLRVSVGEASYVEVTSGTSNIISGGSTVVGSVDYYVFQGTGNWTTDAAVQAEFGGPVSTNAGSTLTGSENTVIIYQISNTSGSNLTEFSPGTIGTGFYTGSGYLTGGVPKNNPLTTGTVPPNFAWNAAGTTNVLPNGKTSPFLVLGTSDPFIGFKNGVFTYVGGGTAVGLVPVAATPEPSSLLLGSIGAMGFFGWSRRRRRLAENS